MKLIPFSFTYSRLVRRLTQLKSDQHGNLLILMGFAIVPLTFTVGFGIDYARAMRLRTQLNAAADAAALAAVAPTMILQSDSASTAAATNMFNSQAALLGNYENLRMTPTVVASTTSGSSGALGYLRKATVSYTVDSINMFGGILGYRTLSVNGTSSASAQQPPNVDFYLAMDNSPSMLLPATSDGITKIKNATGCAFACHAMMPRNDSITVKDTNKREVLLSTSYYTSGSSNKNVYYLYDRTNGIVYSSSGAAMNQSSSYTGASSTKTQGQTTTVSTTTTVTTTTYSITDSSSSSVIITKTITSTPTTKNDATKNGKTTTTYDKGTVTSSSSTYDTGYWADGYWLTHNYGLIYGSPSSLTLRKDDVVSAASQLIPFAANQAAQYNVTYRAQMFSFDWTKSGKSTPVTTLNSLTDVSSYGSSFSVSSLFPADDYWWQNSYPTKGNSNNDQSTEMTNMLTAMNNIIPTAGTGATGSTPQKILFIVTDGMLDQPNGSGRYFGPLRTSDLAQCTAIKAKGIKIAVLYTQYLPESLAGDSWSQTNVAPFLPAPPSPYSSSNAGSSDQVLTALQSCASPGTNGTPLVQTVTTTDNITTALQQLFSTALQTVRLVQ